MQKRLNRSEFKRLTSYLKRNGLKASYYKALERILRDKDEGGCDLVDITQDQTQAQAKINFIHRYKFSIIVPAYETKPEFLKEMLISVFNQTYDNWDICIADASTTDIVKSTIDSLLCEYVEQTDKVRYIKLNENKGISANTNEALKLADGEYVAFLDHDDKLSPDALYEAMCVLDSGTVHINGVLTNKYKMLYSDEDKFSGDNTKHFDFHIKPDFNLELLRTNNYICHLLIVRRELALSVGGFMSEYDGSQDHDFILRIVEQINRDEIAHIPKILYHWRSHEKSTATNPDSKLYAYEAGKRAVADHLKRLSIDAKVEDTVHLGFYRVKYKVSAAKLTKVEIMTFDELKNTGMTEILASDYEYIMILNDDIATVSYEFVEDMLGYLLQEDVGCVGGLVIGRNGKIESAGYEMLSDGTMKPMFAGLNRHFSGYLHRAKLAREADGVCTDCMMVKKEALSEKYGLKPEYRVIYSPYSVFKRK